MKRLKRPLGWKAKRSAADERLNELLDAEIARHGRAEAAPLVGIEQEYGILRPADQIDFRALIDGLRLGRRFLDPADAYAYPRPSGAVWTCDEMEAEIVLPPARILPGFVGRISESQTLERDELHARLDARLGRPVALAGESTHVSISVPDRLVQVVARDFAERCAPAFMLLTGRRNSWGVWIRERPGRIELCSAHVDGAALGSLLAFAAGSVSALVEAHRASNEIPLPPRTLPKLERAEGKPGWYVDRRAFGGEIYLEGRATRLPLAGGGNVSGEDSLQAAWETARHHPLWRAMASAQDLRDASDVVHGDLPLPLEAAEQDTLTTGARNAAGRHMPVESPVQASVFGSAVRIRQHDGFAIGPVLVSWELVVFVACGDSARRRLFVPIPQGYLDPFLKLLDEGALDGLVVEALKASPSGRSLLTRGQALRPGIFDALGSRADLLVPEFAAA